MLDVSNLFYKACLRNDLSEMEKLTRLHRNEININIPAINSFCSIIENIFRSGTLDVIKFIIDNYRDNMSTFKVCMLEKIVTADDLKKFSYVLAKYEIVMSDIPKLFRMALETESWKIVNFITKNYHLYAIDHIEYIFQTCLRGSDDSQMDYLIENYREMVCDIDPKRVAKLLLCKTISLTMIEKIENFFLEQMNKSVFLEYINNLDSESIKNFLTLICDFDSLVYFIKKYKTLLEKNITHEILMKMALCDKVDVSCYIITNYDTGVDMFDLLYRMLDDYEFFSACAIKKIFITVEKRYSHYIDWEGLYYTGNSSVRIWYLGLQNIFLDKGTLIHPYVTGSLNDKFGQETINATFSIYQPYGEIMKKYFGGDICHLFDDFFCFEYNQAKKF